MIKIQYFEFSPSTSKCLIRTGGGFDSSQPPPTFFARGQFLPLGNKNFLSFQNHLKVVAL